MSHYSEIYEDIYDAIVSHREGNGLDGRPLRLMKLSEEVGEVMEAYIGYTGANKRKGYTHTELEVAKELCDVVITAMVALHDWVPFPERFLQKCLEGVAERVEREGS